MQDKPLTEKTCVACKGDTPVVSDAQREIFMAQLDPGWTHSVGHLFKIYKFKNFKGAMEFANKIAAIAEQEHHHPNLLIAWGECGVELWTHAINGLSENDFILAAKIDAVA